MGGSWSLFYLAFQIQLPCDIEFVHHLHIVEVVYSGIRAVSWSKGQKNPVILREVVSDDVFTY